MFSPAVGACGGYTSDERDEADVHHGRRRQRVGRSARRWGWKRTSRRRGLCSRIWSALLMHAHERTDLNRGFLYVAFIHKAQIYVLFVTSRRSAATCTVPCRRRRKTREPVVVPHVYTTGTPLKSLKPGKYYIMYRTLTTGFHLSLPNFRTKFIFIFKHTKLSRTILYIFHTYYVWKLN